MRGLGLFADEAVPRPDDESGFGRDLRGMRDYKFQPSGRGRGGLFHACSRDAGRDEALQEGEDHRYGQRRNHSHRQHIMPLDLQLAWKASSPACRVK